MTNAADAIGTLGDSYANDYSYDSLNRLSTAVNGYGSSCELTMEYSHAGRIDKKKAASPDEDLFYGYCADNQPHAMRRVGTRSAMTSPTCNGMPVMKKGTVYLSIAKRRTPR